MKKIVYILLALCLNVNATEPFKGIEVKGKASIDVIPDVFTVTLTVNHRGAFASKVKAVVDNKSEQVVKAALNLGIAKDNIQSSQVNMSVSYEQPSITLQHPRLIKKLSTGEIDELQVDIATNEQKKTSTIINVNRTISITLSKIELYDRLLDVSVKLGVNSISPLAMSFSDHQTYYKQALDNAINDASSKAANIAKKLGVKLGNIKYIKEDGYNIPNRQFMRAESTTSFSSLVGTQAISAQVLARFDIIE